MRGVLSRVAGKAFRGAAAAVAPQRPSSIVEDILPRLARTNAGGASGHGGSSTGRDFYSHTKAAAAFGAVATSVVGLGLAYAEARREPSSTAMVKAGDMKNVVQKKQAPAAAVTSAKTAQAVPAKPAPGDRPGLPVYTKGEVSKHTTPDSRVWVTYKEGVYDITDFVANHPGGAEKIMLAAGKSIEPFWHLYQQHFHSNLPLELLAPMRVGTLDPSEKPEPVDLSDPYSNEPVRHPALVLHGCKPCNAEAPLTMLQDSWITPADLWYVRNHHPVPDMADEEYQLTVSGPGVNLKLTLEDLKRKFPKKTVTTTIQCGGNRRGGLDAVRKSSGTAWGCGAISTAEWGGASLKDVLASCGIDADTAHAKGLFHVQFDGAEAMKASVPIQKAVSPWGDCLLAYEMNGAPIPRDHGQPVRAVVPGHVGVRNVKWVTKVTAQAEEADGTWQRGIAYKGFAPGLKSVEGVNVEAVHSMQEMPVQSAITSPAAGAVVEGDTAEVRGFAWSGGGRGIVRVDVSADGGETWTTATLGKGSEQPMDRAWAWTFWEAEVKLPSGAKRAEICCKATDASYNAQPERPEPVWNLRGLNNNTWHRVGVTVDN